MPNQEKDEAEILALLHKNRICVWMRDYDGWAECMVQKEYFTRWGWWGNGGVFNLRGFDNSAERNREQIARRPEPNPRYAYDTRIENFSVRIMGDMAWATFDQVYPGGDPQIDIGVTHELRVLERHDGRWLIAVLAYLDSGTGLAQAPRIRLDANGHVEWISPAAETAMAEDGDLVIRNGRLRIRDHKADERLQAAIQWAAKVDTDYVSRRGAVPILMEAGEGEPTKIWWVEASGGLIHFSFGGARVTEQRLETAALIYELSPAQTRLAALVAEGLTLNEIAERMGISANTARTHLDRIYEKTGVRSQPALVRVMLTVAAPF